MARAFDDASNQYLLVSSCPVTGPPLTMSAWFNSDDDTNPGKIMGVQESGGSEHISMAADGSDNDRFKLVGYDGTNWPEIFNESPSFTQDTWHHGVGVLASDTAWAVYLDGNKASDTVTYNPADFGEIWIARGYYAGGNDFSGSIAEVAIWNAALTDAEVDVLATGVSPLVVRPGNLVFYLPLVRDNDEDIIGGLSLTASASPTIATHPPVLYPAPPIYYMKATAAAGDLSVSETDGLTVGETTTQVGTLGNINIAADNPDYQGTGVRVRG